MPPTTRQLPLEPAPEEPQSRSVSIRGTRPGEDDEADSGEEQGDADDDAEDGQHLAHVAEIERGGQGRLRDPDVARAVEIGGRCVLAASASSFVPTGSAGSAADWYWPISA